MSTKKRSPSKKQQAVDALTLAQLQRIVAAKKLRKIPADAKKEDLAKMVAARLTLAEINAAKGRKASAAKRKSTGKKAAAKKKSTNGRKKSAGRKKSPKSKEAMLNRLKLEQLKQLASKNNVCPRLTKEQKEAGKKKVTKENYVRALKNKMTKTQLEAALRPARRQSAPLKM